VCPKLIIRDTGSDPRVGSIQDKPRIGEFTDIMRIIKRLFLLCLLTSALAQVQTAGTVTLTGSVQLMVGAKHSVSMAWKGPQGQYITFRIYRSTTNGTGYQMIQSLISGLGYIDGDVTASTYYYVATTYDSGTNTESGYSNQITVNIPN